MPLAKKMSLFVLLVLLIPVSGPSPGLGNFLGAALSAHAATLWLSAGDVPGAISSGSSHAQPIGYLDVSPNWQAPADEPTLSEGAAKRLAEACDKVRWALGLGGKGGAMIVAGNHPTPDDPIVHITVRVYDRNGGHKYSCHAYVNNTCNCTGM